MSYDDALLSAYADGEPDDPATDQLAEYLSDNQATRETVAIHREMTCSPRAALADGNFAPDRY